MGKGPRNRATVVTMVVNTTVNMFSLNWGLWCFQSAVASTPNDSWYVVKCPAGLNLDF